MRNADLEFSIVVIATFVAVVLGSTSAYANADDADEVDVSSFEYVDVIETVEGSILRGVVTEQTPNVKYKLATADGSLHVIRAADVVKISKQKNPRYRKSRLRRDRDVRDDDGTVASAESLPAIDANDSIGVSTIASTKPLQPKAGLRIAPEVAVVIPAGDLSNLGGTGLSYRTSFAPAVAVGYETYSGNLGLSFGGLVRYTSWQLPVQIAMLGTHVTFETQIYGRAALQLGRTLPYAGLALGVDTNRTANNVNGVTSTAIDFGANVQAGLAITATRAVALDIGVDYHPGTDTIEQGVDASISYFALRLGATIRL